MLTLDDLEDYLDDYEDYNEGDYDTYLDDDYPEADSDTPSTPTDAPSINGRAPFNPSPLDPEVTTSIAIEAPVQGYGLPLGEPVSFR